MNIFELRTLNRSARVSGIGSTVSAERFHGLPKGFALSWISMLAPATVMCRWPATISHDECSMPFTIPAYGKHLLQESSGACILLSDQITATLD
jgi:hypothetical protein